MQHLSAEFVLVLGTICFLILALGLLMIAVLSAQNQIKNKLKLTAIKADHEASLLRARIEMEELERQRIAREVHDEVGPLLALIKLEMHRLKRNHPRLDELLDVTTNEVRQISHNMYPTLLHRLGLPALLRELQDYYTTNSLQVRLNIEEKLPLRQEQEIGLYRITSELLINAVKHAKASYAEITITYQDTWLKFQYQDNGVGFDIANIKPGIGLESIRIRIRQMGDDLKLETAPGQGVMLQFQFQI